MSVEALIKARDYILGTSNALRQDIVDGLNAAIKAAQQSQGDADYASDRNYRNGFCEGLRVSEMTDGFAKEARIKAVKERVGLRSEYQAAQQRVKCK